MDFPKCGVDEWRRLRWAGQLVRIGKHGINIEFGGFFFTLQDKIKINDNKVNLGIQPALKWYRIIPIMIFCTRALDIYIIIIIIEVQD